MAKSEIWVMSRPSVEDDLIERLSEVGDVRQVGRSQLAALTPEMVNASAILGHVPADAEFFDAVPNLKVLATVSVGYNHIDVDAATERGVLICHTPGVLSRAVADLTMCLIYSLALRLFENEAYVRSGRWAGGQPRPGLGIDIRGRQLGIVGFGRIGQAVTERMQLLGMRTVWYDRYRGPFAGAPASEFMELDELLATSDFVSLHTNWEPGTPPVLGARELGLMRRDAFLVNTARGPVVDQTALTDVLRSSSIAGAGLDVLHDEPPSPDEELLQLDNVVCLPHIATATHETRRAMREHAVENLIAVLRDERPSSPVNPEVLA